MCENVSEREIYEDELAEVGDAVQPGEVPPGWRPSPEAIEAIQGNQEATLENDAAGEGEWVDRGIQDVPLDKINLSDSYVQEADDFRKVSHEDMVGGFHALEGEVRPGVDQGAEGESFSSIDEKRGQDYEHGSRRVYDAFYGDDAICLNKIDDTYHVVNGYHRLAVARELGLETVPARVIERP